MKKSITTSLILILLSYPLFSQNQFYDAKRIVAKKWESYSTVTKTYDITVNRENAKEILALLSLYLSAEEMHKIDSVIKPEDKFSIYRKAFEKNPFIQISGAVAENPFTGMKLSGAMRSFSSNFGGLNVTNIANAVADLMIERAKEELTVAFFNRFKKFATSNPEFKILFPKTTNNLENLLSYKYPEMLQALRTGFNDDLQQITFRLDDVLALPRYNQLYKDLPEVKIAIRSLKLVHELETGASNAADVINELAHYSDWDYPKDPKLKNAGNILKTVALISESIRDTVTLEIDKRKPSVWVSAKELKKTFLDPKNTIVATIYLGLLYQKAKTENIEYTSEKGNQIRLDSILGKFNITTFYDKLSEFIVLGEKVNVNYRDLKHKIDENEAVTDDDYHIYIETSLDVVEYGFSLAKLFDADITKAEGYLSILKESNDLYKNIYTKEYNQAIVNLIDILGKINSLVNNAVQVVKLSSINEAKDNGLKLKSNASINKTSTGYEIKNGYKIEKGNKSEKPFTFAEADTSEIKVYAIDQNNFDTLFITTRNDLIGTLSKFLEQVKPYALFIANVAEAKSKDDIKNALHAVILPVGSSSIKKFTLNNLSIQSYLGAYWRTYSASHSPNSTWADLYGVTAPIGLSYTPGFLSWGKGGALSLFVPLFDIGAIVDYKLKKEDSTVNTTTGKTQSTIVKDYSIKLGQIISPGAFIVYGFGANLPLSLGFGAQYGPGLSKIDDNNNIVINNPSWRWNFFLAVDLPFFNVINKSKYTERSRHTAKHN